MSTLEFVISLLGIGFCLCLLMTIVTKWEIQRTFGILTILVFIPLIIMRIVYDVGISQNPNPLIAGCSYGIYLLGVVWVMTSAFRWKSQKVYLSYGTMGGVLDLQRDLDLEAIPKIGDKIKVKNIGYTYTVTSIGSITYDGKVIPQLYTI